jgi:copper chaperone CopZ
MQLKKFKTTLKCSGCVTKITPALNRIAGEGNWEVDLQNIPKILTITANVSEKEIKKALETEGFQAEEI